MYLITKIIHQTCVTLSGIGFALRGIWMLRDSPLLSRRWVRVVPHCVDTLLLASATTLAILSAQYPFVLPWLTAKLIGLLIYILCGMMALRWGRTKRQQIFFFVLALLAFLYIVGAAWWRTPWSFLMLVV
ncbi:MAG: SirB2 family protein [Betaproteobacteria bacterium]|nr:SirB2 family protein [Betaproteobacteria bacterium]